jgi:hypothetical protein
MQVLADPALTQVVQTALDLSPTVSSGNIDAQASMLSKMINFADFQDPAKVTRFTQRFAAMWDATQASNDIANGTSNNPALILTGAATANGMDVDLLSKLQSIKLGR